MRAYHNVLFYKYYFYYERIYIYYSSMKNRENKTGKQKYIKLPLLEITTITMLAYTYHFSRCNCTCILNNGTHTIQVLQPTFFPLNYIM